MGLLQKIISNDGAKKLDPAPVLGPAIDPTKFPPEEPRLCPVCGCHGFWRSIYDLTLRCGECSPWPSRSLVRDVWLVVLLPGGEHDWMESSFHRAWLAKRNRK